MKISAFQTLESVLRHGTMAAAAAEMHLTPSAVSMQIKQIEDYLGQQLFDRSRLHLKPLPLAHEVSRTMHEALKRIEGMRRLTRIEIEGTIQVGVIDSMQPILLPQTMRLLKDRYPDLKVQPSRGKSAFLTDAVKAGHLDAAVVAQPENGGSSRLEWHTLLQHEMVLIAPPEAKERSVTDLLKKHDLISYDRNTITGKLAARYVHSLVRDKRSVLELDEVRAVVSMVSAGLGVSIVQLAEPSICVTYPVRVVRLQRNAPVLRVSLVWRRSDSDNRLLAVLKDALVHVVAHRIQPSVQANRI